MIIIDGSEGEGGGQVLRNALALSLVTDQPFRIDSIRGGRDKPGLMRQHVTAVEAACAIGGAECEGVAVGARSIVFRPGKVRAGNHHFAVGTAGSVSLVLQTILPPLVLADSPSHLVIEGGTHNPYAPPFEFIERCFLPLVERMGPRISARLVRHGFYPAGGGRIEVTIEPAALKPVELIERGSLTGVQARSVIASLDEDIAKRELSSTRPHLDWPEEAFIIEHLPAERGPGNVLLLEACFEHVTEIVCGFGKLGVSAQTIGRQAGARMGGYLASRAFAGPYLADQLLLPMALASERGCFTTVKPSEHTRTAADVISRFLDRKINSVQQDNGVHLFTVA